MAVKRNGGGQVEKENLQRGLCIGFLERQIQTPFSLQRPSGRFSRLWSGDAMFYCAATFGTNVTKYVIGLQRKIETRTWTNSRGAS